MSNEELIQRGYLASGRLKGDPFGDFEELNLGATTIRELVANGLVATPRASVDFPFRLYSPPKNPKSARPDRVFARRQAGQLIPVAVAENKAPRRLVGADAGIAAAEQALYCAAVLDLNVAISTDGTKYFYVDVKRSLSDRELVYFDDTRDLNPAVLRNLLQGDAGLIKDPKPLAETVWQLVWLATKAEPKECLLTFVEIFVLKFLSDNLPAKVLPGAFSFYELCVDPATFESKHGTTAIEYYVREIRPKIKSIFPDNTASEDPSLPPLFGLSTLVSKTSVINGFAFFRSSETTIASFNRTFVEILDAFRKFGPLTAIDPQFKLRLYETFLRRSARQQRLGQFFTPRNVVQPMIKMAQLPRPARQRGCPRSRCGRGRVHPGAAPLR